MLKKALEAAQEPLEKKPEDGAGVLESLESLRSCMNDEQVHSGYIR